MMDNLDRLLIKHAQAISLNDQMVIEDQIRFLFAEVQQQKGSNKPELEYVPVIEQADQQVLTGLRVIIREEIHRMACEG